ncbi:MAG TPA: lysylphosphatidylglycerol synthase transmembrane domain-containing protein [Chloroflexota bacterium]|nr:lysylphosphatidylglycerol synthase transmembrane domain-containing protein [Chloroflexota bacterium]
MPDISIALLAVIPLALVELARASRWRVLFGEQRPSYVVCLRALVSGQVTNALSPVRGGEAVRLAVLAAQGGAVVPGAASLAGVKAIDAICLATIAIAVAGTGVLEQPSWAFLGGAAVLVGGIVVAFAGPRLRDLLERNQITRKLRLASLVDVAQAVGDPAVLIHVLLTTAAVWLVGLAANGVILASVGVMPSLDLMARIIVAGYLVSLLPSLPVQIGTFEAAVTAALVSAGVPLNQAITASVSLHVCQLIKLLVLFGVSTLLTLRSSQSKPSPAVLPLWLLRPDKAMRRSSN